MSVKRIEIPKEEIQKQLEICENINKRLGAAPRFAMVDTFGCQQNEEDSEKIRGYLQAMGYKMTMDEHLADIIVLNTCAVREHAEQRVFGNLGALTHTKKEKPGQIIAVCGCMVQQEHISDKIKKSYPHTSLVFGPDQLWRFPELVERVMEKGKRVFAPGEGDGCVVEGIPHLRSNKISAWLSIMNGCNNFCTYCIVPYTRFRERSRRPEEIIAEAKALVEQGYREITLLGQNVNSYGRDLCNGVSFAELIRLINAIPGDFVLRFMTSHPRDVTPELFQAMRDCEKCENHLHLPLQSGSDRILKAMNRHYDSAKYLQLVDMARAYIPDIVLTTDIIVGFPNETPEDFEETLKIVEKVRFDAMFTFIYSKREGTPAATMDDPFTREEKQRNFDRLLELQNRISEEKHRDYIGQTLRVLIDGTDKQEGVLSARTRGGRLVRVPAGTELMGSFANVKILECNTWALRGELA